MTNEMCIDIETVPSIWDRKEVEQIFNRRLQRKRGDNKDPDKFASLNAEFGKIICIGIAIGEKVATLLTNPLMLEGEKEPLREFWKTLASNTVDRFITFNGKGFDIPFIVKRSAILGIRPTTRISTRRYYTNEHFDVLEALSNFYQGEVMSLSDYCKIFNIKNEDPTTGADVATLWRKGYIEAIRKHCESDVKAIKALYERIKDYY